MKTTLLKNATLVTMDPHRRVIVGDLRFGDPEILEIGMQLQPKPNDTVVDLHGDFVIPGLIQVHTHLVQTLFRGLADDLELLDWLKERIWPLECAHSPESLKASAELGLCEMQKLGTTSILDMGTTFGHEQVFEAALQSGMRYWGGNCLMDMKSTSGPLFRNTTSSLAYSRDLISTWHRRTDTIQYAISPRFVISCSDKILRLAQELQAQHNLIFHTHASENKSEVALVRRRTRMGNVEYLKKIGCLNSSSVIAHAIHLKSKEIQLLAKYQCGVAHCPSSNLKLASGFAKIAEYRKRGVRVGLGADGAPCNNIMDPFGEMRLAALIQKPMAGPTALPARDALEMATLEGARILNAEKEIGSLEVGKRADIVVVSRQHPTLATVQDPYSALVYSATGRDVSDVWINGRAVVSNFKHQKLNESKIVEDARLQLERLLRRARLKSSRH